MTEFLKNRPWIWVYVAFIVLFSAWTALFIIAYRNQPEKIPLEHLQTAADAETETENH